MQSGRGYVWTTNDMPTICPVTAGLIEMMIHSPTYFL
jgi:hypothetical protein